MFLTTGFRIKIHARPLTRTPKKIKYIKNDFNYLCHFWLRWNIDDKLMLPPDDNMAEHWQKLSLTRPKFFAFDFRGTPARHRWLPRKHFQPWGIEDHDRLVSFATISKNRCLPPDTIRYKLISACNSDTWMIKLISKSSMWWLSTN